MATIEFKAKIYAGVINVPVFRTSHCDMAAFRCHSVYGNLANSALFPNVLKRIRREIAPLGTLRVDQLPENITINNPPGFLARVTITV